MRYALYKNLCFDPWHIQKRKDAFSWTDIFRVMRIAWPIRGVPRFLLRGIECP